MFINLILLIKINFTKSVTQKVRNFEPTPLMRDFDFNFGQFIGESFIFENCPKFIVIASLPCHAITIARGCDLTRSSSHSALQPNFLNTYFRQSHLDDLKQSIWRNIFLPRRHLGFKLWIVCQQSARCFAKSWITLEEGGKNPYKTTEWAAKFVKINFLS